MFSFLSALHLGRVSKNKNSCPLSLLFSSISKFRVMKQFRSTLKKLRAALRVHGSLAGLESECVKTMHAPLSKVLRIVLMLVTRACHRFPAVVIKTQCLNNICRETFENYEPKTTKAKAFPDNVLWGFLRFLWVYFYWTANNGPFNA